MENIASKPVKCPDCALWWRGMEHRCGTRLKDWYPYMPDHDDIINRKKYGVNHNDKKIRYTTSAEFKRDGIW